VAHPAFGNRCFATEVCTTSSTYELFFSASFMFHLYCPPTDLRNRAHLGTSLPANTGTREYPQQ